MPSSQPPLRKIKQSEFEKLIQANLSETEIKNPRASLAQLLEKNGYLPHLEKIDLAILGVTITHSVGIGRVATYGNKRLNDIDFSDMKLEQCEMRGCNFSNSNFKNCHFTNCDLNETVIENGVFDNAIFEKCNLAHVSMPRSHFIQSKTNPPTFINTKLTNVDFYKTTFEKGVTFEDAVLTDCVFVSATDNGAKFNNSSLKDCVYPSHTAFFSTAQKEDAIPPKPRVGILWHTHLPGHTGLKIYHQLIDNGAIPIKISYLHDNEVSLTGLSSEVKQILNNYDQDKLEGKVFNISRAQSILNAAKDNPQENKEIKNIIDKISSYEVYLDGSILPGGADIPPDLYGQLPDPRAEPEQDYMRSVLEFAVIASQKNRGNPLMGICRGCQILNVYHGGDMLQQVDTKGNFKSAPQMTALPSTTGILPNLMQESVWGMSMHHQAINRIGDHLSEGEQLEVIALHKGIVKAAQEKFGAPILMTQFHPEFQGESHREAVKSNKKMKGKMEALSSTLAADVLLSRNNNQFIPAFIDAAKQKKTNAQMTTALAASFEQKKRDKRHARLFKADDFKNSTALKKSTHSDKLKSVVSEYRLLQRNKNKDRVKSLPIFKKLAMRLFNFLDRKIFSRKEERMISKLNKNVKKFIQLQNNMNENQDKLKTLWQESQESILGFSQANQKSLLTQVAVGFLKNENIYRIFQEKNYAEYNVQEEIQKFIKTNPTHLLSEELQKFKEQKQRLPNNEQEMLNIIDEYHSKHSLAANNLLTSQDKLFGIKLKDLSKKDNLSIDEIHKKHTLKISEFLQSGQVYQQYNALLTSYIEMNEGNYPHNDAQWKDFCDVVKSKDTSVAMRDFLDKTSSLFEETEKLTTALNEASDQKVKSTIQNEIFLKQNEVLAQIMTGPSHMASALIQHLERNPTLPVDSVAWENFKKQMGEVKDPVSYKLVSQVDQMQEIWRNDINVKLGEFMRANPNDKFTHVLKAYQKENKNLPFTPAAWKSFIKNYEVLSEKVLLDKTATLLLYDIHQKEPLLLKNEVPEKLVARAKNVKHTKKKTPSLASHRLNKVPPPAIGEHQNSPKTPKTPKK